MTTDHLATPHGSPTQVSTTRRDVTAGDRLPLVAATLATASIVEIGLLIWRPWGERNAVGYDDIASIRDNVWLGALLDGLAFGVLAITLGVLVCQQLVRTRGRSAATVGAALTGLGGILFAMGSMAHGAVAWVSTSDVISEKSARALFDLVDDEPLRVMAPVGAGFVLCAIGMLVLAGALIRSASVPRWVPITVAVLVLGQFAPLPGRAVDVEQMAVMASMIALAVVAVRRARP